MWTNPTELWTTISSRFPDEAFWASAGDAAKSATSLAILGAVSSLAGALVGAWAAGLIAERNKYRDELRAELRQTNVAISVAYSLCNTALTFKKQYAAPTWEAFASVQEAFDRRQPGRTIQVGLDMRHLTMPYLSVDMLREHMFGHLSVVGRPLVLYTFLHGACRDLEAMVAARNAQIARFEASQWSDQERVYRYLGEPLEGGHVDRRFRDAMTGMVRTCDDVIHFSSTIASDLEAHQSALVAEMKARFSHLKTRTTCGNFDQAKQAGLFPDPREYVDLMSRIQDEVSLSERSGKRSRWWRRVGF